jgi:hypothetical protein
MTLVRQAPFSVRIVNKTATDLKHFSSQASSAFILYHLFFALLMRLILIQFCPLFLSIIEACAGASFDHEENA